MSTASQRQQQPRVGRDGFTGSPITTWCDHCQDWVIDKNNRCMWCQHRIPSIRKQLQRQAQERNAAIDKRIWRMSMEGRSARTIGAAVGLHYRTVINRQARMRALLPTPVEPT